MPRTFVDLTISAAGTNGIVVARRLQALPNVAFITGEHDLFFEWRTEEEFEEHLTSIHRALAGTGATYRVHTELETSFSGEPVSWPPPLRDGPERHPAYKKRRASEDAGLPPRG